MIHIDANLTFGTLVADRMNLNRLALLVFAIRTIHKIPLKKRYHTRKRKKFPDFSNPFLNPK